ncbi:hypothetical protein [Nonomuraea typhae]|uniref:hypothetical protein n=1 Tax=Nonomuraea typhae TaxID=2603600 RepID=UPI0012FCFFA2|nr:hypothetical protein [Nonomuraea typhae]
MTRKTTLVGAAVGAVLAALAMTMVVRAGAAEPELGGEIIVTPSAVVTPSERRATPAPSPAKERATPTPTPTRKKTKADPVPPPSPTRGGGGDDDDDDDD